VEAGEDPWPARVEGEPLDAVALGLELGQHLGAALRRPAGPLNPPAGAQRERKREGGSQVGGSGLGQLDLGREEKKKKKMCCPLLPGLGVGFSSSPSRQVVGILRSGPISTPPVLLRRRISAPSTRALCVGCTTLFFFFV
jgi:hypothetical protein